MTFRLKALPARVAGMILVWLAACSGAHAASAVWGGLHPIPEAHSLEDVLHNPGPATYIAVGEGGTVLTSPDGAAWTVRPTPTLQKLYGVIWDGTHTQYVAVGEGGLVMTSPDGADWTVWDTNHRKALFDIAYSVTLDRYVAIGQEGKLYTSTSTSTALDTWTEGDSNTGAALQSVIWEPNAGTAGLFVAVGSSRTIISSPDGIDWTVQQGGVEIGEENILFEEVASDGSGSVFVAVGRTVLPSTDTSTDRGRIFTSSDGVNWNEQTLTFTVPGLQGLTWAVNQFVAVSSWSAGDLNDPNDDATSVVLVSTNGTNWNPIDLGSFWILRAVAGDGTNFVAVGEQVTINSTDSASSWTEQTSPATETLYDIAWDSAAPLYLAVGDAGRILTGPDGDNWAPQTEGANALRGIATDGATPRYVVVGDAAKILVSGDGNTWTDATGNPLTMESLRDAIFTGVTGTEYVAVGEAGTIVTSSDGDTWAVVASITGENLNALAYSNPLLVAVGNGGTILTSTTGGASWASRNSGTSNDLNAVAFHNGNTILAVGDGGTVVEGTTTNLGSWSVRITGTGDNLRSVRSNGTQLIAVGDEGAILRIEDVETWSELLSETDEDLNALVWDGERFLAAGGAGTIRTSGGVDLAIDVSAPDSATVNNAKDGTGTVFVYTVTNIGNLDAADVRFENPIPIPPPEEFEFFEVLAPVALPLSACSLAGSIVTCELGRMNGGDAGMVLSVALNPLAEGTFTNTGNVDIPAANDTNTFNNAISSTLDVGEEVFDIQDPDVEIDTDSGFGAVGGLMLALLALTLLFRLRETQRGVGDK